MATQRLPLAGSGLCLVHKPFGAVTPATCRRSRQLRAAALRDGRISTWPACLGGLALIRPAWAEEVVEQLQQTELPSSLPGPEEIAEKAPQAGGGILDLFADNPIILAGVLFLAAIPVALNFLGGGALGVKQVNAAGAIEGLSSDPSTVLIDIRSREEAKQQGSPNLSSVKRKSVLLPFTRLVAGEVEEIEDFVDKFGKLKQIKPDSSIIILDSYGQEAPKAAKQLAKLAGRVYYVRDGAVGANGWKESGQPWKDPGKSLFNLDNLAEDFKAQPTAAKAGVAAGAIGVAAAVLFQEAGTVLELAALAAAGTFALPKLLPGPGDGAGAGTQKRQVKEFVEGSEKQAGRAASKAEKAAGRTARQAEAAVGKAAGRAGKKAGQAEAKVEEAAGPDLGAKISEAAGQVQDAVQGATEQPSEAAGEASSAADGIAAEAGEKLSENVEEAKSWIDNWRKENQKA